MEPDSEFSRWSRTQLQPVEISPELFSMLAAFDTWRERTNGALDASVEAATRLWKRPSAEGRIPSDSEIAETKEAIAQQHWSLDPARLTDTRLSDTPLALASFAKSAITSKAADAALHAGAGGVMVNVGGDVVVRGSFTLRKRTASMTRFLHLYLSMASFGVVFFFAATGLTLNHPDWFAGKQKTAIRHGMADPELLKANRNGEIDKLGLVEALRTQAHMRGAISDVRVDGSQIAISSRASGNTADAFIDRTTGKYDVTEVSSGLVAVVNDLHKGRDTGRGWGWLIDASAILLVLVSITGLGLIWFVYQRRLAGLVLALIGILVVFGIYGWAVP